MTRVLGIDLGTTNSCVAVVENGTPLVVPVERDSYTLPSVVALLEDGRCLVGRKAKRQSVVNAENTVTAAKRVIGRDYTDPLAKRAMQASSAKCVPGAAGDIRMQLRNKVYAIQELSALVLGELKRAAQKYFGEEITQAVITVPAYFNDRQRQATKDAGAIAGLEVLRIINEPTAAALAYGALQGGAARKVGVYDLGGGTFDVSILSIDKDVVEVLATAGDAFLGGRDFDDQVLEWMLTQVPQEHREALRSDRNAMQRLREAAESAKIELSERDATKIALPFLSTGKDGQPLHLQCELTRAAYQDMARSLVERTITMFQDTVKQAGLSESTLDELILVGGMTRMPLIQERVSAALGKTPSSGVHPDLVVAVGAAIQGALLTSPTPGVQLLDVTPHNLGIMAFGGFAETVIPKDTTIPTEVKKTFTTVRDNQETVRIVVYQGDSKRIEENDVLGQFTLSGLRQAPRGQVQIEVSFAISADGIVSVSGRDVETGQEQVIQISGTHKLDASELEKMATQHQETQVAASPDAPDTHA